MQRKNTYDAERNKRIINKLAINLFESQLLKKNK